MQIRPTEKFVSIRVLFYLPLMSKLSTEQLEKPHQKGMDNSKTLVCTFFIVYVLYKVFEHKFLQLSGFSSLNSEDPSLKAVSPAANQLHSELWPTPRTDMFTPARWKNLGVDFRGWKSYFGGRGGGLSLFLSSRYICSNKLQWSILSKITILQPPIPNPYVYMQNIIFLLNWILSLWW